VSIDAGNTQASMPNGRGSKAWMAPSAVCGKLACKGSVRLIASEAGQVVGRHHACNSGEEVVHERFFSHF
jgi:hypothetical protein